MKGRKKNKTNTLYLLEQPYTDDGKNGDIQKHNPYSSFPFKDDENQRQKKNRKRKKRGYPQRCLALSLSSLLLTSKTGYEEFTAVNL